MVELDHFAHFYKMTDEDVLEQLIDAAWIRARGRAEIFREPTRSMICAQSVTPSVGWIWLEKSTRQV